MCLVRPGSRRSVSLSRKLGVSTGITSTWQTSARGVGKWTNVKEEEAKPKLQEYIRIVYLSFCMSGFILFVVRNLFREFNKDQNVLFHLLTPSLLCLISPCLSLFRIICGAPQGLRLDWIHQKLKIILLQVTTRTLNFLQEQQLHQITNLLFRTCFTETNSNV